MVLAQLSVETKKFLITNLPMHYYGIKDIILQVNTCIPVFKIHLLATSYNVPDTFCVCVFVIMC